jgi:hypothetical protein
MTIKKAKSAHLQVGADQTEAEQIRRRIADLIVKSDTDDFASISALLGRSHSYIQQYIRRGSPHLLREVDRRRIARHFGIPETELLLQEEVAPPDVPRVITVDRWMTDHSHSAVNTGWETKSAAVQMDRNWLAERFGIAPENLVLLAVEGDTMAPTLQAGDDILIDTAERDPYRDGIYVLALGDKPIPKRITVHPSTKTLVISSDNAQYAVFENCRRRDLDIIGRVVWVARRL